LLSHPGHISRRGIVPQEKNHRIAGSKVHQHENEKGNSEKNRHRANNPASNLRHLSRQSRIASLSI
jgi:hypothetical protein